MRVGCVMGCVQTEPRLPYKANGKTLRQCKLKWIYAKKLKCWKLNEEYLRHKCTKTKRKKEREWREPRGRTRFPGEFWAQSEAELNRNTRFQLMLFGAGDHVNSQNTTNWIFSWHSFQTPYLQFFWYRFFWAQVTSPQGFLKLPFDAPPRHCVTVSHYDRLTYQMCKISGVPLYFGNQSGTVQKCRNMLQIHPVCGVPVAQCLSSSLICSIWLINSLPYAPLINVRHHIPCSEEDLWLDRWVKIHSKSSSELSL